MWGKASVDEGTLGLFGLGVNLVGADPERARLLPPLRGPCGGQACWVLGVPWRRDGTPAGELTARGRRQEKAGVGARHAVSVFIERLLYAGI